MTIRGSRITVCGLLLFSTLAIQGCLAAAWLGAVAIDSSRTSGIEFQPFENSWVVAVPQERQRLASVKSVGVMPFPGDAVMAERWTAVLQHMTDLHVVSLSGVTWQSHVDVKREFPNSVADREQIGLAQRISAESQVDCVFFGTVAGQEPQKSFAGLKERSSRRLSLHLVSAEGNLLWKTELPFTMVKGAKDLDEDRVRRALLSHVRAQVNEVGLAELGAGNQRTASQSAHEGFDHQMAQPASVVEHP